MPRCSGDEHIGINDHPRGVKRVLGERFRRRRTSSLGFGRKEHPSSEPLPLGRRLTTEALGSPRIGTASNLMPVGFSRF